MGTWRKAWDAPSSPTPPRAHHVLPSALTCLGRPPLTRRPLPFPTPIRIPGSRAAKARSGAQRAAGRATGERASMGAAILVPEAEMMREGGVSLGNTMCGARGVLDGF